MSICRQPDVHVEEIITQKKSKELLKQLTTSNKKTIAEIKSITQESNSEVIKFLSILVKTKKNKKK